MLLTTPVGLQIANQYFRTRSQENVWGNEVIDSWDDQALTDIRPTHGQLSVHISNGIFKECEFVRLFLCKKLCYIWDEDKCEFFKLAGLDEAVSTACLHQQQGLTLEGQKLRIKFILIRVVYGDNEIVVPVKGIITLLFLEVLNPFYVFQLFSFCLWFADDYIYYAMAILAMSAFGIIMAIIQTRKNQFNLRSTVHSSDVAMVLRKSLDKPESIPTEHLVPGDILMIPRHGCVMHCDAVLLTGNCIVNESMLTGTVRLKLITEYGLWGLCAIRESVPVTKTPLPNSPDILYDSKEHARHTLFCGTQVLQTRYFGNEWVLAIVIRTGFSTAKGSLVRSIMYPPPVDFKFEHDSYRFVELLAAIASIGFCYTVITKFMRGISLSTIALEALDLITIVVPPALPAAMTVGRFYAQSRLETKGIYCISPRTINVSGSIDCVCFDKYVCHIQINFFVTRIGDHMLLGSTLAIDWIAGNGDNTTGTLTEDGLDMWGVVPVTDRKFQVPVKFIDKMKYDEITFGMVTCHSLTIIDDKLSGDPLDLKMFQSTGWLLEEPEVNDNSKFEMIFPTIVRPPKTNERSSHSKEEEYFSDTPPLEIGIVRQFPFSSSLQRMSVISRRLGAAHFHVYCKGSPETILSLSLPDTIPIDTSSVLEEYTQEGYRVLALAYRELRKLSYAKAQRLLREEVESNLIFLGFIVMENRLKQGTSATLIMLREANIRTIMVTGDNMLTALSVARDCGIVPFGQRVIVASAHPPQFSTPAQLYYMHANNPVTSSDTAGDVQRITNITSITNLEATDFESNNSYTLCSSPNDYFKQAFSRNNPSNYCFVMTGKTWALARTYFPEIIPKLVTRGAVFARMNPDQKQHLVQELQQLGYYVAMCGDGANDCGALKAAHAGISLSDAESSVASPFTSKNPDISCVPEVIREGRAALVTSFGIFKYMAAYSLTQFVSVMILYSIDNNLSDIEFLYIDLFVITVFAFFFSRTEAFDGRLANTPPILSLISLSPILSLVLQITLVILLQYLSFYCVQQAPWFYPFNATSGEDDESVACYENYALFSISSMQYIILALVFSKGAPYRKSIFSNYGFSVSLIVLSTFTLYLILAPHDWMHEQFELIIPPMSFRLLMAGFGFLNLVLAAFIDYFIIDYLIVKKLRYKYQNIEKSRRKFLALEKEMAENVSWPSISKDHAPDSASEVSWHPPRSPATISEVHVLKMTWFIITNPHSPSVPNWEKTGQVLFQAYWIWLQPVYCFSLEFNPERLMLASVTYRAGPKAHLTDSDHGAEPEMGWTLWGNAV
uniref:P-type ATPase A domain-containing protein n=1 Tax=Timema genevievae TaxID=629358 RepID=A0A7R9PPD8_TIMGE|nr:unnamed protein product [Timema genevievae]